jgi:NADH-quinone oxidoreductase subunit K
MQMVGEMDLTTMSLALSAILFSIGVLGVIVRRNVIILFLCIELMLNAVNLAFVAFSRSIGVDGQIFVFFVMTVAAAEAAVGLALVIAIFRHVESVDMKNFNLLRW